MCWRDDIEMERHCSLCGQTYFGNLGHKGCSAWSPPKITPQVPLTDEMIAQVGRKHGWDSETSRQKIERTKEILILPSLSDAVDFLLATESRTKKVVERLREEDEAPF